MTSGKVKLDPVVLEQIEEIRRSGATNMFDFTNVQRIAYELDFMELVDWMDENKEQYANLILYGPETE